MVVHMGANTLYNPILCVAITISLELHTCWLAEPSEVNKSLLQNHRLCQHSKIAGENIFVRIMTLGIIIYSVIT
ncbi:hypothetical protein BDZ91DRAFT_747594 [Kalaharituber pfeilii]|nr:hypothetical protein BDZ91DRAFT_747594 [Kalaharituber pfeilii]